MVKEYLQKYQQELLSQRIDIENSIQKNRLAIKENKELIHFIDMSQDKSYASFSPHPYENSINQQKIKELKNRQRELEQYAYQLQEQEEVINKKINELEDIIIYVKKQEIINEEIIIDSNENEFEFLSEIDMIDNETDFCKENINNIIHKVNLCKELLDIDKNRCKLELENILSLLCDIIK